MMNSLFEAYQNSISIKTNQVPTEMVKQMVAFTIGNTLLVNGINFKEIIKEDQINDNSSLSIIQFDASGLINIMNSIQSQKGLLDKDVADEMQQQVIKKYDDCLVRNQRILSCIIHEYQTLLTDALQIIDCTLEYDLFTSEFHKNKISNITNLFEKKQTNKLLDDTDQIVNDLMSYEKDINHAWISTFRNTKINEYFMSDITLNNLLYSGYKKDYPTTYENSLIAFKALNAKYIAQLTKNHNLPENRISEVFNNISIHHNHTIILNYLNTVIKKHNLK